MKEIKQVIICFKDGSWKGYNWNAFKIYLKNILKNKGVV